jgi:hypothetical protein
MLLLNFVLPTIFAVTTAAEAAPRPEQVHLQLQTGVLSREALRVEEGDHERTTTQLGPGAGGVGLSGGYLFRPHSELGARLEMARSTIDDGVSDQSQGQLRLAATYTHYFRVDGPVHVAATGMAGLDRSNFDGLAQTRSPFVGLGGSVHWFASPRTSLSGGLELTRTLGGRFEEDGMLGSSRFSATDLAAVAGMNFYLGGPSAKKNGVARARQR